MSNYLKFSFLFVCFFFFITRGQEVNSLCFCMKAHCFDTRNLGFFHHFWGFQCISSIIVARWPSSFPKSHPHVTIIQTRSKKVMQCSFSLHYCNKNIPLVCDFWVIAPWRKYHLTKDVYQFPPTCLSFVSPSLTDILDYPMC